MARLIAKEAGRSNVAFFVLAPVLPGNQVLGSALKPSGLAGGYSVLRGKCQGIRRPHREVAVIAKAILAAKGRETELGQGRHKRFHIKTMKPRQTLKSVPSGNQPAKHRASQNNIAALGQAMVIFYTSAQGKSTLLNRPGRNGSVH